MPIRLNLLAEQQAAEDARRRDPLKRAIWASSVLVGLVLVWIVLLQLRLVSAKAELTRYESKLLALEENSKEARLRFAANGQIESRISHLQRYSTNRFFSAALLDALQEAMVDDVRVVQLQSVHTCWTNGASTFKTNMVIPLETRKAWQFWKARSPQVNVLALVSNQVAAITNKVEALKSPVDLVTKIDITTNANQAVVNLEIIRPVAAFEQVTLTIKARDYSNPAGRRVDEFSKAIASHPYFLQRLRQGEGEGIRLRDRATQPDFDQLDPVGSAKPYIPFVIECRYRESVRANE